MNTVDMADQIKANIRAKRFGVASKVIMPKKKRKKKRVAKKIKRAYQEGLPAHEKAESKKFEATETPNQ